MAGGHSHPDETNQTQQPLRSLPTNLLMGSLKNHLMADGTIGNLTVTGKLQVTGATSSIAVGATPPTAANVGTGIWLDRTGLYSLLSDVYQVKIDATTGQLLAGGGNATLDVNGLSIRCKEDYYEAASLRLVSESAGVLFGRLRGSSSATLNNVQLGIPAIAGKDATLGIECLTDGTHLATAGLVAESNISRVSITLTAKYSTSIATVRIDGAPLYVASGTITGTQLISNIAPGTKPLDVTSTTVCTNLNADTVDGMHVVGSGYTLTVPATGTAALLGTANVFTANQQVKAADVGITNGHIEAWSTDGYAIDKGGTFGFRGQYATGSYMLFGTIQGAKENVTSGDLAGYIRFCTSGAASNPAERVRITSAGMLLAEYGLHVGGTSDPGDNNLLVDGKVSIGTGSSLTVPLSFGTANYEAADPPSADGQTGAIRIYDGGNGGVNYGFGVSNSALNVAANQSGGSIRLWVNAVNVARFNETSTVLGNASTHTITHTGRCIFRTTASDPQHATPGSRPAGSVGEIAYYGGKWYGCTNAATPTWEKITST